MIEPTANDATSRPPIEASLPIQRPVPDKERDQVPQPDPASEPPTDQADFSPEALELLQDDSNTPGNPLA